MTARGLVSQGAYYTQGRRHWLGRGTQIPNQTSIGNTYVAIAEYPVAHVISAARQRGDFSCQSLLQMGSLRAYS
jgi:hypothetical protein